MTPENLLLSRPAVAVVVPFFGDEEAANELFEALRKLRVEGGDEIVVADNTSDGVALGLAQAAGAIRVVAAPLERSSYYARNVGVEATHAPWVLFLDSDVRPAAGLLDAYFSPPVADDVGIVSGGVDGATGQTSLAARYATARGHVDPESHRRDRRRPTGITANLLVRRAAWEAVGGFHEGIRSGGDMELCWRVQDAGWRFDWRPDARVEHLHSETVRAMLRKVVRHAGGGAWANRRHRGELDRPPLLGPLARCLAGVPVFLATGQRERAQLKALDAAFVVGDVYGRRSGNRAASDRRAPPARLAVVAEFPAGEPAGPADAVEALARPHVPDRQARREREVYYLEDDGDLDRLRALVRLAVTHPAAVVAAARLLRGSPRFTVRALAPAALRHRGSETVVLAGADADAARALAALAGLKVETSRARRRPAARPGRGAAG